MLVIGRTSLRENECGIGRRSAGARNSSSDAPASSREPGVVPAHCTQMEGREGALLKLQSLHRSEGYRAGKERLVPGFPEGVSSRFRASILIWDTFPKSMRSVASRSCILEMLCG